MSLQVNVIMESIEGEGFNQIATKPLASMPCGVPGQAFVAFEKPDGECSTGKFSNTLRFFVKEVGIASWHFPNAILSLPMEPYTNIPTRE